MGYLRRKLSLFLLGLRPWLLEMSQKSLETPWNSCCLEVVFFTLGLLKRKAACVSVDAMSFNHRMVSKKSLQWRCEERTRLDLVDLNMAPPLGRSASSAHRSRVCSLFPCQQALGSATVEENLIAATVLSNLR